MRTKIITSMLFAILFAPSLIAQDRTTVYSTNSEISDNLDLRAVASIFGEAENLEDFERRLNDPRIQISNLDLNRDNRVDYLRVIESVDNYTHVIIIQSVLGRDIFQDVATIEVERDRYNRVQVQVVGDVYMYGQNYIYEPVYVQTPLIYASFWITNYRPYCSAWYWNYYPTYYYAWSPCPVYRYRSNVNVYINYNNQYNCGYYRRSERAVALHQSRRANYYEQQYPDRSFSKRNGNAKNKYELDQRRTTRNGGTNTDVAYNNPRVNTGTRGNSSGTRENSAAIYNNRSGSKNRSVEKNQNSNAGNSRENTRTNTAAPRNLAQWDTKSTRGNSEMRTNSGSSRGGNSETRANSPSSRNSTQMSTQSSRGNSGSKDAGSNGNSRNNNKKR